MTEPQLPSLPALIRQPQGLAALSLRQWDLLLRRLRASNLLGRMAVQADAEAPVPAPVRPHWLAAQRLALHQRQAIRWECTHLAEALAPLGIPLVLLKGAGYALADQPAARGRLFGDVDLLVPRQALTQVEAALMLHGWSSRGTEAYDQRYYREWMHELPPMVNHKRATVVDVHHNILPLSARCVPDAELLLADSLPIPGTPFRRLGPCDQVIHSATHLFHEGELRNGLRDLLDLHALLTEHSAAQPDFWSALLARAERLGLVWPVLLALRYTQTLLGTPVPPEALAEARRRAGWGRLRLAWMDALYLRGLRAPLPTELTLRDHLAAAALYLRAHTLRMPLHLLVAHLGRKALLRLVKHSSRST